MGKNNRKRGGDFDSEEITSRDGHGSGTNGETLEDRTPQKDQDFDPYLEVVEELKTHMVASQRAIKNVQKFYKQQKLDIQDAVVNRQKLEEMTRRCQKYKTAIDTLRDHEKEKDQDLAKKVASIEEKERALNKAREEAANYQVELEKERESLSKRVKATEAEHKVKLNEQRMKLEKEQEEKFTKRVEIHEKQTKARQDDNSKKIAELKAKNDELSQKLEERKIKLKEAESRCKDAEKLKVVYEKEGETLKENLKLAENRFGLNAQTTEFYKEKFGEIHKKIEDISSQYTKELYIGDLNALHDKIEEIDEGFASVPISSSGTSEKLRIAHTQRIISAQLRQIIWQPFSSETTLQNPKYDSLFSQISKGLVECYGKSSGFCAARLCTTFIIRGLQSQPSMVQSSPISKYPSPLPRRAEKFTENVMAVLSLLVKPSLHPNLRNGLLEIAKSAISVWDIAQTDERELIVYPTLDPESIVERPGNISAPNNGVIVLFPRITAQSFSEISDTHPISLPGAFKDPETESCTQEICIYDGAGLGEWSPLVLEGEAEEDGRREEREKTEREEKKRKLEEEVKKLENPGMAQRRRVSQGRKVSMTGVGQSPSAVWMNGGGQRRSSEEN